MPVALAAHILDCTLRHVVARHGYVHQHGKDRIDIHHSTLCGAKIEHFFTAMLSRRCHILKTQLRCYRSCDFKTQLRFQNAAAISKNAAAISKRSCVSKTPGFLYCECNRSWIYLGDAYHNKPQAPLTPSNWSALY